MGCVARFLVRMVALASLATLGLLGTLDLVRPLMLRADMHAPPEWWRPLPSEAELARFAGRCQVTAAFSRDGSADTMLCPFEHRLPAFAQSLVSGVVAAEDRRFLAHGGVDFYRVPAAIWSNVRHGRRSGASTLTQQTARTLLLDPGDHSMARKLAEWVLAFRLESVWTKDEILTAYLNVLPMGRGIYGFERGARYHIGKPAKDLTLADSLILIAKAPAPDARDAAGARSPRDLEAWAHYAGVVAARMVEEGFVSDAEARAAAAEARRRILGGKVFTGSRALREAARRPFEHRRVRDLALAQAPAAPRRTSRVFVTLDPFFQRQADAISRDTPRGHDTHAVFLGRDGDVLAISGPAYAASPFNAAFRGSFSLASLGKTVVAGAALERPGMADRTYSAAPLDGYSPREPNPLCRGNLGMGRALALSCNRPFVRIAAAVRQRSAELGGAFGFELPDNPLLIPTGGLYGNPLEVAAMMAAVSGGGNLDAPRALVAIVDGAGRLASMPEARPGRRVMARAAAVELAALLRLPVTDPDGTARAAAGRHQAAIVAGKTGTSDQGKSAWFAGFTADFAGAVVSHAHGRGGNVTGGGYPAASFGRAVDAYWVPKNAAAARPDTSAQPAKSFEQVAERRLEHIKYDAARYVTMLLAAFLLLAAGGRRRPRGGAQPPAADPAPAAVRAA